MAIKVPIRTVFDSSDNAIGLSEFQSGDAVGTAHGGTGLTSLGSAGQVLQVNSGGNGFEFGNKTSVNLDPYLKVANANVNFVKCRNKKCLKGYIFQKLSCFFILLSEI